MEVDGSFSLSGVQWINGFDPDHWAACGAAGIQSCQRALTTGSGTSSGRTAGHRKNIRGADWPLKRWRIKARVETWRGAKSEKRLG